MGVNVNKFLSKLETDVDTLVTNIRKEELNIAMKAFEKVLTTEAGFTPQQMDVIRDQYLAAHKEYVDERKDIYPTLKRH